MGSPQVASRSEVQSRDVRGWTTLCFFCMACHKASSSCGVSQVGLFFLALSFLIVAFATAISSLNHSLCLSCYGGCGWQVEGLSERFQCNGWMKAIWQTALLVFKATSLDAWKLRLEYDGVHLWLGTLLRISLGQVWCRESEKVMPMSCCDFWMIHVLIHHLSPLISPLISRSIWSVGIVSPCSVSHGQSWSTWTWQACSQLLTTCASKTRHLWAWYRWYRYTIHQNRKTRKYLENLKVQWLQWPQWQ